MDTRTTLNKGASFLDILTECMKQQQPAAILYDDNGITRAGGKIARISLEQNPVTFQLDNGLQIALHSVVAVNGIFSDNYTEC